MSVNHCPATCPSCRLVPLVALALSLSACTGLGVEAWERDILAREAMSFEDQAIDLDLDAHVYFSREGLAGGRGFAGGGCGCN